MVRVGFCTTCRRDAYLAALDDLNCPVCASPLHEVAQPACAQEATRNAAVVEVSPVPSARSVADFLDIWLDDHRRRGGDFCEKALAAGHEAAAAAEGAGWGFAEAFEAGRTAYFEQMRSDRTSAA